MHMACYFFFHIHLRFPDFTLLPFHERMTEMITAVVITHFHLDHCAALPYFTEVGAQGAPTLKEPVLVSSHHQTSLHSRQVHCTTPLHPVGSCV